MGSHRTETLDGWGKYRFLQSLVVFVRLYSLLQKVCMSVRWVFKKVFWGPTRWVKRLIWSNLLLQICSKNKFFLKFNSTQKQSKRNHKLTYIVKTRSYQFLQGGNIHRRPKPWLTCESKKTKNPPSHRFSWFVIIIGEPEKTLELFVPQIS